MYWDSSILACWNFRYTSFRDRSWLLWYCNIPNVLVSPKVCIFSICCFRCHCWSFPCSSVWPAGVMAMQLPENLLCRWEFWHFFPLWNWLIISCGSRIPYHYSFRLVCFCLSFHWAFFVSALSKGHWNWRKRQNSWNSICCWLHGRQRYNAPNMRSLPNMKRPCGSNAMICVISLLCWRVIVSRVNSKSYVSISMN